MFVGAPTQTGGGGAAIAIENMQLADVTHVYETRRYPLFLVVSLETEGVLTPAISSH